MLSLLTVATFPALGAPAPTAPGSELPAPVEAAVRLEAAVQEEQGEEQQGEEERGEEQQGEVVLVEEVQVLGTDPATTSASVTVVQVDERLAATADVAEVLDAAAGTTVSHLGGLGDFAAVSIRGSSLRQVQIFLDGIPLNPDGADVVNLSELPLQAFERVEIWRGNAPPRYAASPIGGVVDLISGEDPSDAVAISYGAWETARAFATAGWQGRTAERAVDGMAVADLFTTQGDFRYFSDNATIYTLTDDRLAVRENNGKTQLSTVGRLRWGDDRLRLTLLDTFLSRDEGLPGTAHIPATDTRLHTLRNLAVLGLDGGSAALRGEGRLWLLHRVETFDDREGQVGLGNQWDRAWFTTVGGRLHGRWAPIPDVQPTLTLAVRRDAYVDQDLLLEEVEPARTRMSGSVAAGVDLRAFGDLLLLFPVLQAQGVDNRLLGDVPFTDSSLAPESRQLDLYLSPRAGLLLRPWRPDGGGGLSLKANVGRYVRPPDLTELFGDRGALIGNSDLVAERGLAWDVGGRLQWPDNGVVDGALDLAHFWTHSRDLIVQIQNSQNTSVPRNFGRAWVQGLEVATALDLLGVVDSQTALTFTISRNLTPDPSVADNQLPRIPAWQISQQTGVHWEERLRVGHSFSWTDGNYWDATNFYRAAPRPIHGAFLRARPTPAWPSVELSVLNLADRITQVVPRNPLDDTDDARIVEAMTDFVGYPLPGRTWLLTVRWTGG